MIVSIELEIKDRNYIDKQMYYSLIVDDYSTADIKVKGIFLGDKINYLIVCSPQNIRSLKSIINDILRCISMLTDVKKDMTENFINTSWD